MSCSLCRLPFTPSPVSISPRWPPNGTLTPAQLDYLKFATSFGTTPGLVVPLQFCDSNTFGGVNVPLPIILNCQWEDEATHRTMTVMHNRCFGLLRHHLDLLDDDDDDEITDLALVDEFLGPPAGGARAGRLPSIDYEGALGLDGDRVDLESLWSPGSGPGMLAFDWARWKELGLQWTADRSDRRASPLLFRFPKFNPTVDPARIPEEPFTPATDIICRQPYDILYALFPFLSDASFVKLVSTCRTLRRFALTTLQPHARARVIALGWPLPTGAEYKAFVASRLPPGPGATPVREWRRNLEMAEKELSPHDGDWMLYLCKVYKHPPMARTRRWIWALASQAARVWRENMEHSGLYAVKTKGADERRVTPCGGGRFVRTGKWDEHKKKLVACFALRGMLHMMVLPQCTLSFGIL
ncbi:uncharacterized protein BXZ73DRAFT_96373 [Epithele typhae]|uniref:uncharacterized protein n=1 Tax=Epithele typhae TaxID=378194 RepID=UPI002007F14A|nr:uncharacterized protein BXZ73DRAFT_96373 [Epithele typhae]KAH9945384.1 hypothetical protein BXZ73DRAFT_96373 [Epithele typhae]